jgi:hypothetical protein
MSIPKKYLTIMNKFAQALKTGDLSEVNAIPLNDVKLAKIHLSLTALNPIILFITHDNRLQWAAKKA